MIDVLRIANKITLIHINTMTTYRIPEEAERMGWRRVKEKAVEPELMPAQIILSEFDGKYYYNLTELEARIFETMRVFEFLSIAVDGRISPTERGRGIIDGSIKTNANVPDYFKEYLAKPRDGSECGTAGSQT